MPTDEYAYKSSQTQSGERNPDGTVRTLPHSFSFEKVPLPCSRLGFLFIFLARQPFYCQWLRAPHFRAALLFIDQIHIKETEQHQLTHLESVPSLKECPTFDFHPILSTHVFSHLGKHYMLFKCDWSRAARCPTGTKE